MSSVMKYKDYIGSVEFSEEDQIFYGKVLGIHSLISYEGESAKELIQDFHEAVDDYLELCAGKWIEPEKAYKGSFNVRISPDLYRSIAIHAIQDGMTLNKFCNGNRTIIRFWWGNHLFRKKTDGYLIEGEGYILAGRQNKIRKRVWKWEKEYVQKRLPVVE